MLIEKAKGEIYAQCRIPGIVVTESGTLLAYYECRKTASDWADIDIKVIRSTDDGETWQTVLVVNGNGNTLNNPVMVINGEEIHFLFLKNYKQLFHCVSKNDGLTFSDPTEKSIRCDFFYNVIAVGPGHGITHNGNMIVPIWFAQNKENAKAHRPSFIATLYSTDGEQWTVGEIIGKNVLKDPSECALALTAENKMLISIRNENPCQKRAFALSDNGIHNWSEVYFHPQIPDPTCMGSMCHTDGTIYHINCASDTARENLTVKISDDGFKSFKSIFVDKIAGYSDIAVKNGSLHILYERDCNNGGLYFKKI